MDQTHRPSCTESVPSPSALAHASPWWLPGGHLQTIYASLVAPQTATSPSPHRAQWATPDGDVVVVDSWRAFDENAPTLVLFHGLEGGSDSHYAKAFALVCASRGWHMVLPHFRGCGGTLNQQPRAYHSGDHAEIDWMLRRVRQEARGHVHAVGISLGGNALLCWAEEHGSTAQHQVSSVASVCAPLDLVISGLALEQGLNRWLYTPRFLRTMQPKARAMAQRFPGLFDLQATERATTLREFDDAFTAPLHGFAGVMDYWKRASAKPHLKRLHIPSLILNALNDPFVPQDCLPKAGDVNACTRIWQPLTGGHLGFVAGHFPGELVTWGDQMLNWMSEQGRRNG